MLAKQGIHIKDSAFLDPNEEGLLYQLLKAAEKIEERRQKREQEGGGGGGGEDEEDDFGTAMFDVGLLAELLSRPTVFSIDDLGRSELMRRLLESDDDLAKSLLTPDQMDSVIAALMQSGSKGAQETATLRRRRLQLLEEARRMKDAAEKAKRDAEAAANNQPAVEENKDTFDLTEVALPEKEPQPEEVRQKTPSRPTSGAPSHGELVNDMDRIISPIERPSSKGKKPPPPPFVLRPDEISEAQRREQELLFQQFEEFVAEQESQVVYKVTFHEYSPEQLEAFFRKLHLGPQQQALLRGRAPLASNISLDGGTYHQLPTISRPTKTTVGFQFGSSMPRVTTDQVSVPVKVAPVKLFTLTAQDDIQGAIRENFHSYLDDRSYQMALRQRSELPAQRTIPEEMRDPMERGSHLPPTDSQKRVGRGFNFSKPEPTPESQAEEKANASSTPPIPPLTSGKTLPPLTKRNP
ncbi:hypothetical protein ADEAN_000196400 [Angomonas deanei]|uniref:Uncharacterized protein n=1 Tax=Angomonas deanei TaxID=59799 RepID=A0A7G2C6U0_9TRYP|nr:hypothetical protein ADEAN_000196400 [Angomonas deanei]